MYFFCSGNTAEPERADPDSILRCLMRQASDLPGGPPLHSRLAERFARRSFEGAISGKEATAIIVETIKDRPLTYIVIDALDECNTQKRFDLISSLKTILADSKSLVKIFITSSDNHGDITRWMIGCPAVCIDASQNKEDIDYYIQYSVEKVIKEGRLLPTERVDDDLQQKISQSLSRGAAGV